METHAISSGMTEIPLNMIIPGDNPRRHFDPAEMQELADSIRIRGVLQPILVRPADGMYKIVAGERRVRASLAVFGPEGTIRASIMEFSDEDAEEAALIENIQRADMSVTEEARAAGKILARNKGDRDETARVLGWPMMKLNRRLALLNLTEEVMQALDERQIQTGHAELLASAPKDKQNPTLAKIIENNLSVQFVKENLLKRATKLADAIFDKSACVECQFNSEKQASLFSENIGDGFCTNSPCFEEKIVQKLESLKGELADEFPAVRIIEPGDNSSFTVLEAEGNLGVGEEQYATCKGCGNFGATVSSLAGELGKITKSVCFDLPCQQKKVSERIKARKEVQASEENTNATGGKATTSGTANKTPAKKQKTDKPAASETSQKVKEYRRKIWNGVAKREFAAQPEKAKAYLFDLAISGDLNQVDRNKLKEIYQRISGTPYPAEHELGLVEVFGLPQDKQDKLPSAMAVASVERVTEKQLTTALRFLEADLGKYWRIDAEFLNLLTKSEIEAVAVELGLDTAMGDGLKKALAGKKDELVKAVLSTQFEWNGAVPKMIKF